MSPRDDWAVAVAEDRAAAERPERRVQCTVTVELAFGADSCDAAVLVGFVREAIAAHPHLADRYPDKLIGLVGEVPGDPESVHRWAWRAGASSTIPA